MVSDPCTVMEGPRFMASDPRTVMEDLMFVVSDPRTVTEDPRRTRGLWCGARAL